MTRKTYETKRLILKPVDLGDQAFIFKQFSNDIVNQYLFDAEPLKHPDEALEIIHFYQHSEPRNQERYILLLKDSLTPIGTLGYHAVNHQEKTLDIGYDLDPNHHFYGYMREGLAFLINLIQHRFDGYAIHACIYKDNQRSIDAVKHFGFTYYQTYMEHFRGEDYEHHIYRFETIG